MSHNQAFTGCDIFDGHTVHRHSALLTDNKIVTDIINHSSIPDECQVTRLPAGTLVPGFVDLQVNGGGGVLLNDHPTLEGIKTICATHGNYGTTSLLPTLITDTPGITTAAIEAGISAHKNQVPGFSGLHLEGPHLCVKRKGAHEGSLIRSMSETDLNQLLYARERLPNLMITVAPESVTDAQITTLSKAGVLVSLGHTNASFKDASNAINAGARCITHLFNAMSPLNHREPGVVGCALSADNVYCGLIADGYHVNETVISLAMAAKNQTGKIFLVTDAMSTIGTEMSSFTLNGREILRRQGRLTLADGTLAGADLTMITAIRNIINKVGADRYEAFRMASLYPAQCLNILPQHGHLKPGAYANMVHLDDEFTITQVWQNGDKVL